MVIDHHRAWTSDDLVLGSAPRFDQVHDNSKKFAEYDRIFVRDYDTKKKSSPAKPVSKRSRSEQWSVQAEGGTTLSTATRTSVLDVQEMISDDSFTTLTDHQFLLLQPQAPAFALSAKQWSG